MRAENDEMRMDQKRKQLERSRVVSRGLRRGTIATAAAILCLSLACRPWQPASGRNSSEELYRKNCVTCHGINGGGADGPSLIARPHTPEEVAARVRSGGNGMKSFQGALTDEEINQVSQYAASLSQPKG